MRIGYIEAFSGISGDMMLGALVDAGVPVRLFEETVAALGVDARIEVSRVERSGISATKVDVWAAGEKDMPREQYWREREHEHGHDHGHAHDHGHEHHHHASGKAHRGLRDIRAIIEAAAITPEAKQTANAMFEALGAAEAKIHNVDVEEVHFHEVGAVDAIVDIVCAAVGAHALGVDEWVCSPLNVGGGTVECAHGRFPVPAPAALELLKGTPVYSSGVDAELVTPTGAAIVKILTKRFGPMPALKVSGSGYGAGTRDFPGHANVLRITIGEAVEVHAGKSLDTDTVAVLEANLDDLNPQVFGYVLERALAEGALDVFGTPVQMKKNRPGMLLTVLSRPEDVEKITKLVFAETTTLGIRIREERRQVLARRSVEVQTPWGKVRMKLANLNGTVANFAPEYEDCRRIASERGIPLKQVMQEASRAYLVQRELAADERR
jgi:uncharacterized protein (TIGR00299 family) protein